MRKNGMHLWAVAMVSLLLILPATSPAQTCPWPPADCAGALHCGGEWDFENGFYFTAHALAGQCAAPPGGGNQSCVPADKFSVVANGWSHWAAFPNWPTPGYWGTPAFNENKNCDNVMRGHRSQEITLTCANGVGVIYKRAAVPVGHRIRVEAHMRFTPNGPAPDVEHDLGLDPAGGADPAGGGVHWTRWQEADGTLPGGQFNKAWAEAVSTGPHMTVFIRMIAREPPCQGQTFMIDNVKVFDFGPAVTNKPGDLDGDGDVDLDDFGKFQICFSGAGTPPAAGCVPADLEGDNDVDAGDLHQFLRCFSGPNVLSAADCTQS